MSGSDWLPCAKVSAYTWQKLTWDQINQRLPQFHPTITEAETRVQKAGKTISWRSVTPPSRAKALSHSNLFGRVKAVSNLKPMSGKRHKRVLQWSKSHCIIRSRAPELFNIVWAFSVSWIFQSIHFSHNNLGWAVAVFAALFASSCLPPSTLKWWIVSQSEASRSCLINHQRRVRADKLCWRTRVGKLIRPTRNLSSPELSFDPCSWEDSVE